MSKTREYWWSYVKAMVRNYPKLQAQGDGVVGGAWHSHIHRPVEDAVIGHLSQVKQRELTAIKTAIQRTRQLPQGEERLALITMMYWDNSHTMDGASLALHISQATAKRYHGAFIYAVAEAYGLCD